MYQQLFLDEINYPILEVSCHHFSDNICTHVPLLSFWMTNWMVFNMTSIKIIKNEKVSGDGAKRAQTR